LKLEALQAEKNKVQEQLIAMKNGMREGQISAEYYNKTEVKSLRNQLRSISGKMLRTQKNLVKHTQFAKSVKTNSFQKIEEML